MREPRTWEKRSAGKYFPLCVKKNDIYGNEGTICIARVYVNVCNESNELAQEIVERCNNSLGTLELERLKEKEYKLGQAVSFERLSHEYLEMASKLFVTGKDDQALFYREQSKKLLERGVELRKQVKL